MKLSLSTGTLYVYPLRTVFRWARAAGFDGVELVVNPEAILRGGRAIREIADAKGVTLFSVHPSVVPLPGWREKHDGPDGTIRLALDAGASQVVLHCPRAYSLEAGEGLALVRSIEAWQPRLAGRGLRLCLENKAVWHRRELSYALTSLRTLRAFADRHNLGLVLDTVHAATAGQDILEALLACDGRLENVHLSDSGGSVPFDRLHLVRWHLAYHRFPGSGTLPLDRMLASLAGSGYAGPITLEISPIAARLWWPRSVRRRLARAVDWLKRATGPDEACRQEQVTC